MERLANLTGVFSASSAFWITLQAQGHHVLDLVQGHPWTSLGIAVGTVLLWSYVRAPKNLPPGPSGLPFIGPLSGFSGDLPHKLLEWRKKYGEVVSFYRMGKLYVVLNGEKSIREAFVKRGDEFGHRANNEEIQTQGFHDDIFPAVFNETWKKNKRFTVSALKQYGFGTAASEGKIHEELNGFEEALLASNGKPIDISWYINKLFAALIWSILLDGATVWNDPELDKVSRLILFWFKYSTGMVSSLGMFYYILHPKLARFTQRRNKSQLDTTLSELSDLVVSKIKAASSDISGREPWCVMDAFLNELGSSPKAVQDIANNIMSLLPDSIETSARACDWAILYLLSEPEVIEKLHSEIITVCGPNQLPTLADRSRMPLHQAVMYEALRFNLIVPMSLPRVLHQDLTLNNYTLPRGSIVEANVYGLHFDPEVFPDPQKFNPSRFIKSDGKFDANLGAKVVTFSIGNRMCVGEAYFKVKFFFLLTRLTQRFHMKFDPSAPKPSLARIVNFLNQPPKFKVCFQPR